jgi:hypothetical protein
MRQRKTKTEAGVDSVRLGRAKEAGIKIKISRTNHILWASRKTNFKK